MGVLLLLANIKLRIEMWKDLYKIEDKKDLDIIGLAIVLIASTSFFLIFLRTEEIVPGLLLSINMLAVYAIILLRNIEVIESELFKGIYRRMAYLILIIYPFYMVGMIWVYYFYQPI